MRLRNMLLGTVVGGGLLGLVLATNPPPLTRVKGGAMPTPVVQARPVQTPAVTARMPDVIDFAETLCTALHRHGIDHHL